MRVLNLLRAQKVVLQGPSKAPDSVCCTVQVQSSVDDVRFVLSAPWVRTTWGFRCYRLQLTRPGKCTCLYTTPRTVSFHEPNRVSACVELPSRCLCTCYEALLKQVMKLEHAACPGIMWETRSCTTCSTCTRYVPSSAPSFASLRSSLPEDSKYYPGKTCAPPNMKNAILTAVGSLMPCLGLF